MHGLELSADGQASMVYAGAVPWHGLGTVVPANISTVEALKLSRADFEVHTGPLQTTDGVAVQARYTYRNVEHPNGTVEKVILGHHVGMDWHPLQNKDAFAWFDPFLDAGEATIESAGVLRNGCRVWVLASLTCPDDATREVVDGDEVRRYILLSNGHDGRTSVHVGYTPIRVVCWNTLSQAIEHQGSKLLKLRHTAGIVPALGVVRDTMRVVHQTFEATMEQYKVLASVSADDEVMKKYVRIVVSTENADKIWDGDVGVTDGLRVWGQVQPLIETAPGQNIKGVQGTLWAAYNGVTRWLGHTRGKTDEQRLETGWFGDGAKLNARALTVALELAKKLKG